MSADPSTAELHSAPDAHVGPAHSLEEEAAHARQHAKENIYFFVTFFVFILGAVASYELSANSWWQIWLLAACRVALIVGFFVWLIGSFSFVVRTVIFTILFFAGMIFLSLWDSTIRPIGDPIQIEPSTPAR